MFQEKTGTFSFITLYVYEIFVITKEFKQVLRLFENVINVINCSEVLEKYKF